MNHHASGLAEKSVKGLPLYFHLKWTAKIALSVAVLACLVLVLILSLITDKTGAEYGRIILSDGLTRANLMPAILIYGLVMTVVAGIITWLISLYGSFRVAGPLYRFCENIRNTIEQPTFVPVPIRHTDMLQAEWKEFAAALTKLNDHYRSLNGALAQAKMAAFSETEPDLLGLAQAVVRLREAEQVVRL